LIVVVRLSGCFDDDLIASGIRHQVVQSDIVLVAQANTAVRSAADN
jgi:hypothetical protein